MLKITVTPIINSLPQAEDAEALKIFMPKSQKLK